MDRPLKVLSLGAGRQSSCVLLMSARGELPKLDAAIFADTQWEPRAVYQHLDWLEGAAKLAGIPVYRVTRGDLRQDGIDGSQFRESKQGKRYASIPLFILNQDGTTGMIRRQCTSEYKIEPIEKFIKRELLGLKPGQRAPVGLVDQWFGISADETRRMRLSSVRWKRNVYPLIGLPEQYLERPMTVRDCIAWFAKNYPDRQIPRSACKGCPYRSDAEWRLMRDEDPEAWADAVDFDYQIRRADESGQKTRGILVGLPFVHRSCKPLDEVDLSTPEERGQMNWINDCQGMCGV